MKIFISFDWEGISGVSSWRVMDKKSLIYEEVKKNVEKEIKAILEGIKSSGVEVREVTICDSHAFGENISFSDFPEYVNIVRGFPRKYYMLSGLNDTYNGVIFLGYHSPVGTKYGGMDHTYSSSSIYNIRINDYPVGESEINGLYAGDMQIPVLLITGDDKLFSFSSPIFSPLGTEFIITKESYSKYAGKMYNHNGVLSEIQTRVSQQMKKIKEIKPLRWKTPYKLTVELTDTLRADLIELIPGVKRVNGRTVEFSTENFKVLYKTLIAMTIMGYSAKLI